MVARPQERIVRLGKAATKQCFLAQNQLYDCEHMVFNPRNFQPEHRPLDSVNRMRLDVYLVLRQVRRKLNMVGHEQLTEARPFGWTSADAGAAECRE